MPLNIGDSAPPITGTNVVANKPWLLQDHAKKSVLLAFSGMTWCSPCQKEAPALEMVWQHLSSSEFAMAVISGSFNGEEDPKKLQIAIEQFGITFPVVPAHSSWPVYEVSAAPTLYCLHWNEATGRHEVAGVHMGAAGTTDEIADGILEFLEDCGVIRKPSRGNWAAVFQQIFGGVDSDGGGWGIRPGGKPFPIGPWDPLRFLGPAGRDALVGLAVAETAGQIRDLALRQRVREAGIAAAAASIRRLSDTRGSEGNHRNQMGGNGPDHVATAKG